MMFSTLLTPSIISIYIPNIAIENTLFCITPKTLSIYSGSKNISANVGLMSFIFFTGTILECGPRSSVVNGRCICNDDQAFKSPDIDCITTTKVPTTRPATQTSVLTTRILTVAQEAKVQSTTTTQTNFTSAPQNTTAYIVTSKLPSSGPCSSILLCAGGLLGGLLFLIILLILLWCCCRKKKCCFAVRFPLPKRSYKAMV